MPTGNVPWADLSGFRCVLGTPKGTFPSFSGQVCRPADRGDRDLGTYWSTFHSGKAGGTGGEVYVLELSM